MNAALGTIELRSQITITAAYVGTAGMEEALKGPLRNKDLTRFSIKDPKSSAVFELMYCKVNSNVFNKLININDDKHVFTFKCIKVQGEFRNGAILAQSIKPAKTPYTAIVEPTNNNSTTVKSSKKYRIIMTDNATSNRVITTDVKLGEKYNILGNTIIIENMNSKSSNVKIIE